MSIIIDPNMVRLLSITNCNRACVAKLAPCGFQEEVFRKWSVDNTHLSSEISSKVY